MNLQEVSKKVINQAPKVSKRQFFELAEPGDIVLASPPKRFLKMKKFPLFTKMIMVGQGLKTSSSKMIVNDDQIAGYGVLHNKRDFSMRKLTTWLPDRESAILIRMPSDVTPEQTKKAVNFMMKYINAEYDKTQIFQSGWRRVKHRFKNAFMLFAKKTEAPMSDAVEFIKETYICSNVISVAYYKAGYKKQINNNNVEDTWPKDFLLDPSLKKVARFGI